MIKKLLAGLCTAAIFFNSTAVAFAADTEQKYETFITVTPREGAEELTLDKAIQKATQYSSSLKKINSSLDLSDSERTTLYTQYLSSTSDNNLSAILSLLEFDVNRASTERSQVTQTETLAYTMKQAYIEIIEAERALALEKLSYANAERDLVIARTKASCGLLSSQELEEQELSFQKTKTDITQKEINLEEVYSSLNTLIGVSSDKKYTLSLEPEYEELTLKGDLASHINVCLSTDPNVEEKQDALDLAEEKLRLYTAGISSSYASLENGVNNASLALRDEKTSLETKIKNCYNSIISLEESYQNNLKEMQTLRNQLDIAQKKYDMKMITESELENTKYKAASMENTLASQQYEHMLLLDQFEKPYLG